jgi:predicted molibdopterin-dependent oxidoreductase YjgC
LRWGDRARGQAWTPPAAERRSTSEAHPEPKGKGLLLGTYRDLWASDVTKRNPALRFLMPEQKLELAAKDAEELKLANGDPVTVSVNGSSVEAKVAIRARMKEGAAFLIEGTDEANANVLANGVPQRIKVTKR